MPEWLEFRLNKIDCAFREFPKLKYRSLFYLVLVILAAFFYMPILKFAHGFNYFGNYPLQNFIAENASWLVWGRFVVPLTLVLFFYWDISDRHDEKYLKKYRQLPKWIN
ncbi:hypothetical protein [Acinetobacter sp. ANC 5378]|uniref:hypothetical protein n=1 Tax=Acinetobacter sp. ANC 5378 TaxID=2731249 RepID=UPI0014907DF0|nr:hypothetical protein [Acinetobacter sp. ANC 5378]NNG82268.1 hypothetical protein [Acinetobacter sp. ANC 5378]